MSHLLNFFRHLLPVLAVIAAVLAVVFVAVSYTHLTLPTIYSV